MGTLWRATVCRQQVHSLDSKQGAPPPRLPAETRPPRCSAAPRSAAPQRRSSGCRHPGQPSATRWCTGSAAARHGAAGGRLGRPGRRGRGSAPQTGCTLQGEGAGRQGGDWITFRLDIVVRTALQGCIKLFRGIRAFGCAVHEECHPCRLQRQVCSKRQRPCHGGHQTGVLQGAVQRAV